MAGTDAGFNRLSVLIHVFDLPCEACRKRSWSSSWNLDADHETDRRIFAGAIPLSLVSIISCWNEEKRYEGREGWRKGSVHELYYSRYKFPRIELCEQRFPLLSNDHVHGHVAKRVVDYFWRYIRVLEDRSNSCVTGMLELRTRDSYVYLTI